MRSTILARVSLTLTVGVLVFHFQLSRQIDAAVFTQFGWTLLMIAAALSLISLAPLFVRRQRGQAALLPAAGLLLSGALLIFYFPSPKAITLAQLVPGDLPLARASLNGVRQEEEQARRLWQEWSQVRWKPLAPDWSPRLMMQGKTELDWGQEPAAQFLFYPAQGGGRLTVAVFRYSDRYAVVQLTPSQGKESQRLYCAEQGF